MPARDLWPPQPRIAGLKELLGTRVTDRASDLELGRVEDVVVDLALGKVTYVIVAGGGLPGGGARLHPVPWSRLQWGAGHLVLAHHRRGEELARGAPSISAESWRNRGHDVIAALTPALHEYYDTPRPA